jgi:hypothetical protein
MSFDLNSISTYVDQTKVGLIGKTITSAKTVDYLTMQVGVKGSTALNLLTNTVYFQNGNSCSFSNSGSSTLSQRNIVPGIIKVNKEYCPDSLLGYWAGYEVEVKAGKKTLPFQEMLINKDIESIGSALEKAIWQGDTNSSDVNLNKFDGLIKIIDAVSGSTQNAANGGITGITSSNIITLVNNVYAAIPSELIDKEDVIIFAGNDTFRTYVMALAAANLYHYTGTVDGKMEVVIPGTSIKMIGVPGLIGTNRMFAFQTANVYFGTDLENDKEAFDFWYSQDDRNYKLEVKFSAGVQVAFPDQIVRFKLA